LLTTLSIIGKEANPTYFPLRLTTVLKLVTLMACRNIEFGAGAYLYIKFTIWDRIQSCSINPLELSK
jgi:hypothetical protein